MMPSIMEKKSLEKNTRELEQFIKKAKQKLVEVEAWQSLLEKRAGKGRVYKSADNFMRRVKSKLT